jgi:type I restriction enzyme R subunit
VRVLGDETLRTIAWEFGATVLANVTIDWAVREKVRPQLRVHVKRILRKHGYPPDKQDKATQTVLEQADVLSGRWQREKAVLVLGPLYKMEDTHLAETSH